MWRLFCDKAFSDVNFLNYMLAELILPRNHTVQNEQFLSTFVIHSKFQTPTEFRFFENSEMQKQGHIGRILLILYHHHNQPSTS